MIYTARIVDGVLHLAKWNDGPDGHGQVPEVVYHVTKAGRGKCDCPGSYRNPYCKHRRMIDEWRETGVGLSGAMLAEDGTVYDPEDGEGIPMSGVVDLGEVVDR